MKLLKNQQEFEEWTGNNIFDGDIAKNPIEFPCYVNKDVLGWNSQTIKAVYLYRNDIENMLESLLPPNATVKISTL